MPGTTPLSNIALIARPYLRFFFIDMVRLHKKQHDSRIHVYCVTREEAEFYGERGESLFESINVDDALLPWPLPKVQHASEVYHRAREIEKRLGLTINTLAVRDRFLGRGYALGGLYHPRSRQSEGMDYAAMVHVYNEALEYWESEVDSKQIDLMINCTPPSAAVAQNRSIPIRALIEARYLNHYTWVTDDFDSNPAIEKNYRDLEAGTRLVDKEEEITPPHPHLTARSTTLSKTAVSKFIGGTAKHAARQLYRQMRGRKKGQTYLLRSEIAYRYRQWRDLRRLTRGGYARLTDLSGTPFVFYPLHTEPERALQALSPEYFFQLSCIASISRDLPAGVLLAVKEHTIAIGRRPADWYKQISEFKNVVMLDVRERGLDVTKAAEAVVTITSTAGMEAAVLGKPVITFGRHNAYNLLRHVSVIKDEAELSKCLADSLNGSFDHDRAKEDGRRFLQAVRLASFELGSVSDYDTNGYREEHVETAYRRLLDTLQLHADDA